MEHFFLIISDRIINSYNFLDDDFKMYKHPFMTVLALEICATERVALSDCNIDLSDM